MIFLYWGTNPKPPACCAYGRQNPMNRFDFQDFNTGDYYGAVESQVAAENITKILYPNDEQLHGRRLRLEAADLFCFLLPSEHD